MNMHAAIKFGALRVFLTGFVSAGAQVHYSRIQS